MIGAIMLLIKGGGVLNCTGCGYRVARIEKYCPYCGQENNQFEPKNLYQPSFEECQQKWCREERHLGLKECINKEFWLTKLLDSHPYNYCSLCGVRVRHN